MLIHKPGRPFLYDEGGDIVGIKDADGGETLFARAPRLGVFFDTTNQVDGDGPVAMTFNTQALSRGVSLSSASRIYVDRTALYEFALSTHMHNTDTQAHTFEFWGRKNGVDIPYSRFIYSVPSKHGTTPGATIPSQNFFLNLIAGDYVEIVWTASDANVTIAFHDIELTKPVSPSLLLTVKEIATTAETF